MKFCPLYDRVVILRLNAGETTVGGIMGVIEGSPAIKRKAT